MKPGMSLRRLLLLSALTALLALIACGGSASPTAGPGESTRETAEVPTETPEVSRRDVLTSLTGRVIVPRYRQASDAMGGLEISVDALCAVPGGASLETARTAWRDARAAWVTTGAFRFGPAMDRRSVSLVDWWPVSIERIEGVVSEGELVTTETVRQFMPSTQRGMGAMEHLLFGDGSDALAGPAGAMRCGYLEALATVAHDEIDGVRQDWEGDGESPGYDGFFDGSASSSLHPREGEAEVVRSLVFMVRTIANMRLGAALGVDTQADPVAIPSGAAGHSREDLRHQLLGISEMYQGADGDLGALGISHRVRQLSPEVDSRMAGAIEACRDAVEAFDGSLESAIAADPAVVRAVYDSFKELQRVLNTEVVSLLGVSVGFSDTDGDS